MQIGFKVSKFFHRERKKVWSILVNSEVEPKHDPIQGDENPRDHDNPTNNEQKSL